MDGADWQHTVPCVPECRELGLPGSLRQGGNTVGGKPGPILFLDTAGVKSIRACEEFNNPQDPGDLSLGDPVRYLGCLLACRQLQLNQQVSGGEHGRAADQSWSCMYQSTQTHLQEEWAP